MKSIEIARDFSRHPAGRFRTDGPFSGERFRDDVLKAALSAEDVVEVIFDGTSGYGSSFLEEAFGGLVRKRYFSKEELERRLTLTARQPLYGRYARAAAKYIKNAQPE